MPEEHFDAVVVGSGFGGATMACRLAEAGMSVCLLERGQSYPPGTFARDPYSLGRNWWDPSEGLYGMFQAWSFAHIEAIVASGLGGGSLIYANVLIRKDEHWFRDDNPNGSYWQWPVTRRELDPAYDRVEEMLKPQRYPMQHAPYKDTPKTIAFRAAADHLKRKGSRLEWYLPPLGVTFGNRTADGQLDPATPGQLITGELENLHRSQRFTCRLCGECDIGCNYGSKNTLDFTYLSAAWRAGAEIRQLCEVKSFKPRDTGRGYNVQYVPHDVEAHRGKKHDTNRLEQVTITGDRLILSAGTLGSSYLLLKNRHRFPRISSQLGTKFCTNGDLITFAFRARDRSNRVSKARLLSPSYGPVITSTIRVGDKLDGDGSAGRGFYLQDAGFPAFLSWIIEAANAPGVARRVVQFAWRRLHQWLSADPDSELSGQMADLIGLCENSSGSMPLLGMGRDIPDGRMSLRSNRRGRQFLEVDWKNVRSKAYFDAVTETSRGVAEALGARFIQNPSTRLLKRLITVHPLGGCPMGSHAAEGVVNARGEVFNYPDLYVADGSIMPGPVGANPSLTIAAMSELIAEDIVAKPRTTPIAQNLRRDPLSK